MQQRFVQGHPLGASHTLTEKIILIYKQRPSSSSNHGHQWQRTHSRCRVTSFSGHMQNSTDILPLSFTRTYYLQYLPAPNTTHTHSERSHTYGLQHFQAVDNTYPLMKKTHLWFIIISKLFITHTHYGYNLLQAVY